MTEEKRALLGDREAAKRLTEAGVLLPCWHCGGADIIVRKVDGLFGKSAYQRTYKYVQCRTCFSQTGYHGTEPKARLAWNTRAPILSESDLKKLRGGGEED